MQKSATVLTIGGSDSSGGAGVQGDLRALSSLGVHGCSVVTCITSQNTEDIASIFPVPTDEIRSQFESVISDIEIAAVKTGMLYSKDIVETVAGLLKGLECPIVVDPVLTATVGKPLHTGDYAESLKEKMIPLAHILTPNVTEASHLAGLEVISMDDLKHAAKNLSQLGAENIVVKGFREGGDVVDVLYDGKTFAEFRGAWLDRSVHGTGCAYASSIAAHIAKGMSLQDSIAETRKFVATGMLYSYNIGKGVSVVNSQFRVDRYAVMRELEGAVEEFKRMAPLSMIPEVGTNFGYALPMASSLEDVCAVRGRMSREDDSIRSGQLDYGESKHVGTIILTAMRFDPEMRSVMNLRYDKDTIERARGAGLKVKEFDRSEEPQGRSTMEWGVESVARKGAGLPDVIFDKGSVGKEAMIRLLGRNPRDVLRKAGLMMR
jgi:hydroxymethylpyrimidine/phosphomethylpyrimidine kinase